MRTLCITIDEELLARVDQATRKLGTTRSEFISDALRLTLRRLYIETLEGRHREGYARYPVTHGEFDIGELGRARSE